MDCELSGLVLAKQVQYDKEISQSLCFFEMTLQLTVNNDQLAVLKVKSEKWKVSSAEIRF